MTPSIIRSAAAVAAAITLSGHFYFCPVVEAHRFGLRPYHDTLEIMWLQDFSISYEDDLPNLQRQLPDIFEELKWVFPHSHFGLAGFTDKPLEPFGYKASKDYCYELKYHLSRYTSRIQEVLAKSQIHSGGDWKEAQFQALVTAALSTETNWWPNATTPNGYNIHRVIVLATDAGFHQAGDASNLTANAGDGSYTGDCTHEDYPSVVQVRAALEKQNITPIFLVSRDVYAVYAGLVRDLGYRGIVWMVEKDSANVKDAVFNAIQMLLEPESERHSPYGCKGQHCCEHGRCTEEDEVLLQLEQMPKKFKIEY